MSTKITTSADKKLKEKPTWVQFLTCYSVFAVLATAAALFLFRVRLNFIQISFYLGNNRVATKGISNVAVLIFGIVILSGIVFMEDYLRKGVNEGLFWRRVLQIVIVEAILFALSMGIYYIFYLLTLKQAGLAFLLIPSLTSLL
jgi:hypothetical protein